ncbi:MAG: hypothetical protein ACJ8AK_11810 [Gemmatimonadaceae bacterium]
MDLTAPEPDTLAPKLKEAGETALELMKQLITLSSGVLALSAAFLDKFRVASSCEYVPLALSWALLIVALIAALDTISAIVKSYLTPERPWHVGRGKRSGSISKWAFVLGISAFAIFAFLATVSPPNVAANTATEKAPISKPAIKP